MGSVATYCRRGRNLCIREFSYKSNGERILKIGQYLPKLLIIKHQGIYFLRHTAVYNVRSQSQRSDVTWSIISIVFDWKDLLWARRVSDSYVCIISCSQSVWFSAECVWSSNKHMYDLHLDTILMRKWIKFINYGSPSITTHQKYFVQPTVVVRWYRSTHYTTFFFPFDGFLQFCGE